MEAFLASPKETVVECTNKVQGFQASLTEMAVEDQDKV